jgi:hypothetical protein
VLAPVASYEYDCFGQPGSLFLWARSHDQAQELEEVRGRDFGGAIAAIRCLGHDEPFRRDYRKRLASKAEGRKPAASQTPAAWDFPPHVTVAEPNGAIRPALRRLLDLSAA